ncbi:multiple inositol polyphosphate phosphatase 1-like [Hylaeus anthracinus]|uniref:multiple inositol polyphosphate phosphatase 1-like n=1 Tax=Hylaeus anthracinus TaxID=313031 RepID=UPI0023B8FCEA|nr:multiple inositol polyphosphate phosphatase 1-like [Hylaeus anthracinus]XP_053996567.1 multiple inositol polyphosphate phosphatase 1-like [Hylaeus anthracinus]
MSFKMNASLLLVIFLINLVYTRDVDYCFADETDPYLYLATKTAYHFVHAGKTRFQDVPNCEAAQIWMVATHGTRCPSTVEIAEMLTLTEIQSQILNNHETRRNGHMCDRDLENLKRWKSDAYLEMERAEILTPQGVEDMRLLARRLQSNFPHLLQPNGNITPEDYLFKTVDAGNSMKSFKEGLFGNVNTVIEEEVSPNDTLLAAYKTCNSWLEDCNNISTKIVGEFENQPEFQTLIQNVSRRLGYLYNLSKRSILTMYDMCRYEKAWTVTKLSPWCAVFSKDELRVLEYREDLHYYYKAGYGRAINAQLGCTLLQDMMNHFWKVEKDEESVEPRGIFYFSDIISLQNLLTTLNINKDQMQLKDYNYKDMAKRQWRTSFISSFAANLVAVFYKCDGDNQPKKVMFYLAEKLVMMDGCDVGLCDWEYFKQKFNPIINRCDLNACLGGSSAGTFIPNIILVLFSCFTLILIRE